MIATPTELENITQLLLAKLEQEGFTQIEAKAPGYTPPKNIFLRESGQTHTPYAEAIHNGNSYIFDIDLREPIPLKLSRHKWSQMARWASIKYGRYFLVVKPSQIEAVTQMCEAAGIDMGVLSLTSDKANE